MKKDFPLIPTKVPGLTQKFDLTNPAERHKYFQAKLGPEIEKLNAIQY